MQGHAQFSLGIRPAAAFVLWIAQRNYAKSNICYHTIWELGRCTYITAYQCPLALHCLVSWLWWKYTSAQLVEDIYTNTYLEACLNGWHTYSRTSCSETQLDLHRHFLQVAWTQCGSYLNERSCLECWQPSAQSELNAPEPGSRVGWGSAKAEHEIKHQTEAQPWVWSDECSQERNHGSPFHY